MAALTLLSKKPGMNLRLVVAGGALAGGSTKNLVEVAIGAVYGGVRALKREEARMIEIAHPVEAIMAGQTIRPKLGLMFYHKGGCRLGVAGHTKLQIKVDGQPVRGGVAPGAIH